jgi:septation ring formation regulator
MNNIQENKNPASASLINLSQLNTEILVCLNNVNKMSETVRTASADEQSAREQLVKLSIVLSEVQSKIRNNRIPNISTQYDDDVRKAEEYINKLENLLNEQPINVTLVNSLKNSAVELVYQLYESVNRILGTAIMAENAIVIGNMYRSTYSEIDSELTRAELAYRNGEYTQALTIALNTIKKVHPETVEQLINGGKKDNA